MWKMCNIWKKEYKIGYIMQINKQKIILNALLSGKTITLGKKQTKIRLFKPDDIITTPTETGITDSYNLCLELEQPAGTYLGIDDSLCSILNACNDCTDEYIISLINIA